jgi:adenosylmethionine-8-amino-7-oxononanoate aminotransferase
MFFHSSSYTANPIACAAALANLAVWQEEPVAERIAVLAARQQDRLASLSDCSAILNRRRIGTITAMEIGAPDSAYLSGLGPRLLALFRGRNLLLRPLGNTVYVMPPYCIGEDDLDQTYEAIADAADAMSG